MRSFWDIFEHIGYNINNIWSANDMWFINNIKAWQSNNTILNVSVIYSFYTLD